MSSKPNILLLISDEHHFGVSGYAGDSVIETPALDDLARRGVSFDAAYCQAPICTPSRMSLLTGKNTSNCSVWSNHWVLCPEHRTIADHFAAAGYATSLVGKMHFGGRDQYHGFQSRPYGDLRHGGGHQPDPIDMFPNKGGVVHAGPSEIPESLQQETIVSIETAAWIKEHRAANPTQPWLACASYNRPHGPLTCPQRYFNKYLGRTPAVGLDGDDTAAHHPYAATQRENYGLTAVSPEETERARAAYWGAVDFLDDCIGLLLWQLDREGALDNTFIVYISDHGDMIGHHGLWWKAIYYEEAIRVPFLIAGPGIPEGLRRSELVALTDLFPTLCQLAGLAAPEAIDGIDVSPILQGNSKSPPRESVISEYFGIGMLTKPYRSGSKGNSMRLIRTERYKYVNTFEQGDLLFDLQEDPREYHNRIDDADFADIRESLSTSLNAGFTWDGALANIEADRQRAAEFRSGQRPSTPNQYQLADGRVFDAEAALYNARWLQTESTGMSGTIPQMYH
jgi:choline-sulfatase